MTDQTHILVEQDVAGEAPVVAAANRRARSGSLFEDTQALIAPSLSLPS